MYPMNNITMSKIDILLLLILCIGCNNMNDEEAPVKIIQKFDSAYQGAENLYWNRLQNGHEANFSLNGRKMEVEYTLDGELREVETLINRSELPQKIIEYVEENYPMLYIEEVSVEEEKGKVVYELEMLNGFFRDMELEFDMEGNLIDKERFTD